MGKLNIELSSNSSEGGKKPDKKPPNGATISDKRDKRSVCAYMGCKGPCYAAAAEPTHRPLQLDSGWESDAVVTDLGLGHCPGGQVLPGILPARSWLGGRWGASEWTGSRGNFRRLQAPSIHPPSTGRELAGSAGFTCLAPPLPAVVFSQRWKIKLTTPTGGSG